jgi:ABC-type transporter lipoprotein component MlaA
MKAKIHCLYKSAIIFYLFVAIGLSLPPVGKTEVASYDYPITNPLAATVVGTPQSYQADLPKKIPVKHRELEVFTDREIPDILWYNRTLRYSFVAQEGPAPLIFVIAGTGASYHSPKMQVLQRALYQGGFHVLSLSSPTHPNFIASASISGMPGHLLEDSQDLYRVMRLAWLQIREEAEVTDFHVTGYSLGAAQAAFVSRLDDEQGDFQFRKVLMINPPVSLYNSTSILDEMLENNIPGGIDHFPDYFDRVFRAFTDTYRRGDFVHLNGDFLYSAYKNRQPADEDLAALIGTSFRISAANMFFTSDVLNNSGYIKPKNLVLSTGDSVTDYFKVSGRVSFLDYFRELFSPYFQNKYPGTTEQMLIDNLSLFRLEEYLRQNQSIGLVHNADDIILAPGELDYLLGVFGDRAKLYPRGGHCGNLEHRDNIAYIVQFFQPETDARTQSLRKPSSLLFPKPFPVHFTPSPKDRSSFPEHMDREAHPVSSNRSITMSSDLTREIQAIETKLHNARQDLQATKAQLASLQVYSGKDPAASATDSTDSKADLIEPAQRPVEDVVRPGVRFLVDEIHDPIESFNRRMYLFNAKFDEHVFLPVVEGYETVMPDFFEDRVSDFFSNIADIRNLLNAILQLKGETSLKIFTRFLVNSTFGLGGFFDHATPLGYPQQIEDFGQTLGHYGLNPGPYLVLPIFGPSSVRDTTGLIVDSTAQFFYFYVPLGFDTHIARSAPYTLTNATDTRHQLSFRYYQTGSPFEYDLIRLLHRKNRELEIAK